MLHLFKIAVFTFEVERVSFLLIAEDYAITNARKIEKHTSALVSMIVAN